MSNVNTVTLSGNLTRDVETRQLSGDNSVTNGRLAVNTRKKVDGEWTDVANYFDLVFWGGLGATVAKYTHKGSSIVVSGRLEWREWEKDGEKRQSVQVVVQDAQFFFSKDQGDGESRGSAAPQQTSLADAGDDSDIPFHHRRGETERVLSML